VGEFQIPSDITALDDAALVAAIAEAEGVAATFNDIPDADLTDEQFDAITALADFVVNARGERDNRASAAAERAEKAAAARASLAKPEEAPAEETAEAEPEPVTAAATPRRVTSVVARAAAVVPAAEVAAVRPTAVLVASADIPGVTTGSHMTDLTQVGDAAIAKMKTFPTGRVGGESGTQIRGSVARIEKAAGRVEKVRLSDFGNDHMAALTLAADEHRLPGDSLVAAGTWCAPSETLYDLCSLESTAGLLDLPEISVDRGGIRFMERPDFSAIYNSVGFWLTEADVAGGELKTCIEVDCPDWDEVRLDAVGLCIKAGILTNAAFPEYVRYYTEAALIAHQHKISANLITQMVAASTAIASGNAVTATDSLSVLASVADYVRQQYRTSFTETFEVVAPFWYKNLVRADLARRTGLAEFEVTDAQIDAWFALRGLRIQWVYNYQPLTVVAGVITYPETAQVLVYPAGTFVKGTTDVINLDTIYDSTNILSNTYTALFAEEGIALVKRCFNSWKVTVPTCATGQTGAADLDTCLLGAADTTP